MLIKTAEAKTVKAPLNRRLILGTKAETLARLRSRLTHSVIGEQICFEVGIWRRQRAHVIKAVRRRFGVSRLAVRSSSKAEDTRIETNAGRFLSIIDVDAGDEEALCSAIESVVDSFQGRSPKDQVLIQAMVCDVILAGVGFTRSLTTGAPYYVINYDDQSGRTDTVTRGSATHPKLCVIHRSLAEVPADANTFIHSVVRAMREVERLVGSDALDVEFAVDKNGTVHLLQVRRMTAPEPERTRSFEQVPQFLVGQEDFRRCQTYRPAVFGSRTIFGVMPDWNPAEMIGMTPRRLATALYRYLITDEMCGLQRAAMGYHNIGPNPLMIEICGHPYIDLRASFSSFIPRTVSEELAGRLVQYYLTKLEKEPHLHDKVEFEVALTSMTFDFPARSEQLRQAGFSDRDINSLREGLVAVTRCSIDQQAAPLTLLELLRSRLEKVLTQMPPSPGRAIQLLRDCRRLGTPAFAQSARAAFIAVAFLRSAVVRDLIRLEDMEGFLRSLSSGVKAIARDASRVRAGALSWEAFVATYGHLRPGTYDLTVPSYGEAPEFYLMPMVTDAVNDLVEDPPFAFSQRSRDAFQKALRELGLPDDVDGFIDFLRTAIEGRELAKFVFTRNVSRALSDIAIAGAEYGLSADQMSQLTLEDLLHIESGCSQGDAGPWLAARAEAGQHLHDLAQAVELPPLVVREADLVSFVYAPTMPNFVGRGHVVAPAIEVGTGGFPTQDLAGKVVLLANGDPGYDWLFMRGIAGLVTLYGGVNSHMAIRAGELGIPAALGVGSAIYAQCRGARMIRIDGLARQVQAVA